MTTRQPVIPNVGAETADRGVCVIKHWLIHNYIPKDRFKPTVYKDERDSLAVKPNKAYSLMDTDCIHDVSSLETQVR